VRTLAHDLGLVGTLQRLLSIAAAQDLAAGDGDEIGGGGGGVPALGRGSGLVRDEETLEDILLLCAALHDA
jgi:hypothetical protein